MDTWQIRTSIQTHTYHEIIHEGHANVDEEFISTDILSKVHSDSSIKPKAIQDHFKDLYGVKNQLPESLPSQRTSARNHRRFTRRSLRPSPTVRIARKFNVETLGARLNWMWIKTQVVSNTCSFALPQSAMGFAHYRPLLGLDGTHLTHTY